MYSLHTWGIDHLKEVYHLNPFLNILLFLRDKINFKHINRVSMVSFKLSKLYFKNAWHPIP